MSRTNNDAYNAACKAAHEIFLSCVASIEARIAAGEISRDDSGYSDDLSDAIHEEADSACIYTADCWILAYGLSVKALKKNPDGTFNASDALHNAAKTFGTLGLSLWVNENGTIGLESHS